MPRAISESAESLAATGRQEAACGRLRRGVGLSLGMRTQGEEVWMDVATCDVDAANVKRRGMLPSAFSVNSAASNSTDSCQLRETPRSSPNSRTLSESYVKFGEALLAAIVRF
jgi:hypothetical protein